MIAYFPVPYPDELLFSVLCRGTEHSGMYAKQSYLSQLLQEKKSIYLNMKYYNRFSEDAITFLGGDVAVRNLIMCHTLYPYDMRFASYDIRKNFYDSLPEECSCYGKSMLRQKKQPLLRYCPICTEYDRHTYGETYWHRNHQLETVEVCPEHGVKLIETNIGLSGKASISNHCIPAESYVTNLMENSGTQEQQKYARYQCGIMNGGYFLQEENFSTYLANFLKSTKYVARNGEVRLLKELDRDCKRFYQDAQIPYLGTPERINAIFKQNHKNPVIITQIAYFLEIPMETILYPCMGPVSITYNQKRDDILAYVEAGNSYRRTADVFHENLSKVIGYCKEAGIESSFKKEKQTSHLQERIWNERKEWMRLIKKYPGKSVHQISAVSNENRTHMRWLREHDKEWTEEHMPREYILAKWKEMDLYYLPLVKQAIKDLLYQNRKKPTYVSFHKIAEMVGCKESILRLKLPKCREEIERNKMDSNTFLLWKLQYAIHALQKQQSNITFAAISRNGGPCKNSILKRMDVIDEYADEDIKTIITELLHRTGYS